MSNELPTLQSYGDYSSDNYGAHTLQVFVGGATIWFSYKTPVAFRVAGNPRVVRENDWGPTTGKHLNWIDGGGESDHAEHCDACNEPLDNPTTGDCEDCGDDESGMEADPSSVTFGG